MKYLLFTLSFSLFLFVHCCQAQSSPAMQEKTDSTVTLFDDTTYKLTLHIFDAEIFDWDQKNATLTLTHTINNYSKTIFTDSLFCMHPWIEFCDFNNDKVKDILVFNTSGTRSSWSHYLYLVDMKNHKLRFVKRFKELLNPEMDKRSGIITSTHLYGQYIYYSFFRINQKGILVKAGRSYEDKTE